MRLLRPALSLPFVLMLLASGQSITPTLPVEDWSSPPGATAFGRAVAIDGDRAAISYLVDSIGHVEIREAPDWSVSTTLVAPPGASDRWGHAIAMQGDTLVVGDWRNRAGSATSPGTVDVYEADGSGAWGLVQTVAGQQAGDRMGRSFDFDGDRLAVGGDGSAYILRDGPGGWSVEARFEGSAKTDFGAAVALAGDRFATSAPGGGFTTDCSKGIGPALPDLTCIHHSRYGLDADEESPCLLRRDECPAFWDGAGKVEWYARGDDGWKLLAVERPRTEDVAFGAHLATDGNFLFISHRFSYDHASTGFSLYDMQTARFALFTSGAHPEISAVTAGPSHAFIMGSAARSEELVTQWSYPGLVSAPYVTGTATGSGSALASDGENVLIAHDDGVMLFPASRLIPTTP